MFELVSRPFKKPTLIAEIESLESRALMANLHVVGELVTVVNADNTVTVSGKLAGLGNNEQVLIEVSVPVTFTVVCVNPAGKVAPGQTHTDYLTGAGIFASDKNGNIVFSVTTNGPEAHDDDCPNPKWTPMITYVSFGETTVRANGVVIS